MRLLKHDNGKTVSYSTLLAAQLSRNIDQVSLDFFTESFNRLIKTKVFSVVKEDEVASGMALYKADIPNISLVLLCNESLKSNNPFLRLALAIATKNVVEGKAVKIEDKETVAVIEMGMETAPYSVLPYIRQVTFEDRVSFVATHEGLKAAAVIIQAANLLSGRKQSLIQRVFCRRPIAGVAVAFGQLVFKLPKPFRHHHILNSLAATERYPKMDDVQGFYTGMGRFVNRLEGAVVAHYFCQVEPSPVRAVDRLFSEDLWSGSAPQIEYSALYERIVSGRLESVPSDDTWD